VHGQIRLRPVSGETNLDRLLAAACRRGPDNPATGGEMLVRPAAPGGPLLLVGIDPLVGENEPLGTSGLALLRVENLGPHAEADAEVEERLHQLLGLTAREAHLALSLAAGRSLAEHAVGRGVSLETARTHLRGLFAKTDTSRQGELVALLNRITRGPR
jgi:DNA-binding CsgD family transcriptional regulator